MRFLHPEFFWLFLLLPLLAVWWGRRGNAAAVEYSHVELFREVARQRKSRLGSLLCFLRLLTVTCVIIALARPQWGSGRTEVESSGIDIVLAVDMSGSMEAIDYAERSESAPRIDIVKNVVAQFIEDRESDRIGIVGFAGRPYLISPLTLDHSWLQKNLERIRLGMVEDGTAIGSALASSVNRLRDQKSKSKIVILLTDGINNSGKIPPETAADAARALGIKVYTIGVGSVGHAMIPVQGPFGRKVLRPIQSDVDEESLKKVADTTGGKYFRATDADSLREIYKVINQLEKTKVLLKKYEKYEELFPWILIPGGLFLFLEFLLSQTRYRRLP